MDGEAVEGVLDSSSDDTLATNETAEDVGDFRVWEPIYLV